MKQELPNLVDERRFRRREPEQVERDEFGRVSVLISLISFFHSNQKFSASGPKRKSQSILSQCLDSTFELKSSVMEELM